MPIKKVATRPYQRVPLDLTRTDEYDYHDVPDEAVEIALKVIRTARNVCLMSESFDAEGAVLLSHAHAKIVEMARVGSD